MDHKMGGAHISEDVPGGNITAVIAALACLALHTFVFLLTEALLTDRASAVFGGSVTMFYSVLLILLSAGFISFSFITDKHRRSACAVACVICPALFAGTFPPMPAYIYLALAGLYMFTVGFVGSAVYGAAASALHGSSVSARLTAVAICSALVLQFAVQKFMYNNVAAVVCVALSMASLAATLRRTKIWTRRGGDTLPAAFAAEWRGYIVSIAVIALMSIVCGVSDGIFMELHAQGHLDVYSYPRFLYPLGLILAGVVADYRRRACFNAATAVTFMLMIVSALFLDSAYGYQISLCIFYFTCGFYVLYLTITFFDLAAVSGALFLWAPMGRVARSLTLGAASLPLSSAFAGIGVRAMATINVGMLAVIFFLFFVSGGFSVSEERSDHETSQPTNQPTNQPTTRMALRRNTASRRGNSMSVKYSLKATEA